MAKMLASHRTTDIRPAAMSIPFAPNSASPNSDTSRAASASSDAAWQVEVFHDGDCPLCQREISMLRWMDRRQRIRFTDIAAADFDPASYGKTMPQFMDQILGRLPDGTWLTGVEVFRRLYAACGLSWLVAPTRLPGISHTLDWGYRVFARNRLKLTGRCGPDASECKVPS